MCQKFHNKRKNDSLSNVTEMLPKKRKFTPTDYESWRPEPPEAHQSNIVRNSEDVDAEVAINLVRSESRPNPSLDLTEWVGHRILARRDQYFCPGVIKAAYKDNSVAIDFETEESPLIYCNVLSKVKFSNLLLKKNRQIEGRSALPSWSVNKLSRFFFRLFRETLTPSSAMRCPPPLSSMLATKSAYAWKRTCISRL